jgi:membrane fusion protein, copper/silver efflux system
MSNPGKTVVILCVAAAAFLAGSWYSRKPEQARRILYYHDPMHPAYKSDKPGVAPDCGMQLEPVYADGGAAAEADKPAAAPAGTVHIDAGKQQVIGVMIEEVKKGAGTHTVRVPGRVTVDETRVFRVASSVDGWIRQAASIPTGSIVRKGDVLATFYNRDFLSAQQTYLYGLNSLDRFKDAESAEQLKLTKVQVRAAEENLEFLGMSEAQMQEVARTRQVAKNIELRSSVAGLVLNRNVFPGLRFDRGTELYRIADLDHVWIYADVFENDADLIRRAKRAAVRYRGVVLPVRMSDTLPQFDAATRALKVRLEVDNPKLALRPDMFVDVEFEVQLPPAVTVPASAVIDSGVKKTVYVDRGNGMFEPRLVETAWRLGDRAGIARGLEPGERIVVSGNFLIDSETRMTAAAATDPSHKPEPAQEVKDPVCGMETDAAKSLRSEHGGKTYYFCSDNCKQRFEKDPAHYIQEGKHGA